MGLWNLAAKVLELKYSVEDKIDGVKDACETIGTIVSSVPSSIAITADEALEKGKDVAGVAKEKGIELGKKAGEKIVEEAKELPNTIEKKYEQWEKEQERQARIKNK